MTATDTVKFLLVDDLSENLLSLEAVLRREGLEMIKARSGVDALEMLLKHDVALALLDVMMPEMDGFELAETMRGNERTRRIPIIFLTAGSADRVRRFRGYEAGAVDYLEKPLEPDILRSKCDVFFELYRQRQQIARQRDNLAASAEENRRLLKESQQYARALQEADQRKDEFLATLAHELRNPLAPISNSVTILASGRSPKHVREQALGMMERQVKQMVRLVDDLMDVARITRGKIVLKPERLDVRDILNAAVEISQPLIDNFDHTLIVDLPKSPVWLEADLTRLAQVFSNLLNNAAKYSEPGREIRLSAETDEDFVTVRIKDQGLGMTPETIARIFDMFAQADGSLERAHGGLGVGLTLVKALVEMHGGTISASSDGLNAGSEFAVRLPLAEGNDTVSASETPSQATEAPPGGGLRILIVEDNEALAQTTGWMIEMLGHDYKLAHNGPDAIELSKVYRPDVVMMDIGLPGMNGYDLCAAMKQEPHLKNTVFIAQTGWGQDEHRQRAKEAGFDHHLVKPVYLELLQETLGKIEKDIEASKVKV
ncbi:MULTISPECIES: response regulator [Asticcacaulis]|uniref:response regulator n=1 Tax=Asticcacaulis TaxID=76890 RepID=UPI001AEA79FD|nr:MULTISPECIES: response regulator [Asticcacaulis]MBP2161451.1 signal transduction histidine kinase [Asticcacaulis solisilvae]MDR6802496.1 signal transduction histidine kinase [Asticcacaulis sp. BE141]